MCAVFNILTLTRKKRGGFSTDPHDNMRRSVLLINDQAIESNYVTT